MRSRGGGSLGPARSEPLPRWGGHELYYRTDRLKEYGIPAPKDDWTWDDFLHNSGSSEEQKGFVGEKNFATVPLPLGPALRLRPVAVSGPPGAHTGS